MNEEKIMLIGYTVIIALYDLSKSGKIGVGAERESFVKMFGVSYDELMEAGEKLKIKREVAEDEESGKTIKAGESVAEIPKKKAGRKPKVKK